MHTSTSAHSRASDVVIDETVGENPNQCYMEIKRATLLIYRLAAIFVSIF